MNRFHLLSFVLLFSGIMSTAAQTREEPIMIHAKDCDIQGTLMIPEGDSRVVALIVPGSGPTDRNGNQNMLRTNTYKMLATALAEQNIASVRYDKRGIAASAIPNFDQSTLRLSHYIDDVKLWVETLKKRYPKVIIIGHSEGSLLGMAAISEGACADGFVSLAGCGRKFDVLLKEQLAVQPAQVRSMAYKIIDSLSSGYTVEDIPVYLQNLFHPSIQPYLMSMFEYDPPILIRSLKVPILIIQGDTDIQIKVEDAKSLHVAAPKSKMCIIKDMNHTLKNCATLDRNEQLESYYNPSYPIVSELIEETTKFILALNN